MFTPTMSLFYAQSVQEDHLRRAQTQRLFSQLQRKVSFQSIFVDNIADFLITSGRSLKQRYQSA
ncbi:MAG: hypothetical protein KGY39_07205 [Anaerolineales bacterium]|nr:hypothetical protein [Anaerolineales bacterium]